MTKRAANSTRKPEKRLIHGANSWLAGGTVPSGKEWVLKSARAIKREYIRDLVSDPSELSAGQIVLLGLIEKQLVFLMLIDSWIMEHGGPLTSTGEVQPAMGALYLSMANSISRNCEKLGLKRISPGDDLESYLKAKYQDRPGSTISPGPVPVKATKKPPLRPRKTAENE